MEFRKSFVSREGEESKTASKTPRGISPNRRASTIENYSPYLDAISIVFDHCLLLGCAECAAPLL